MKMRLRLAGSLRGLAAALERLAFRVEEPAAVAQRVRAHHRLTARRLLELLDDSQIDAVLAVPRTHKEHPLARLLRIRHGFSAGSTESFTLAATDQAVGAVGVDPTDRAWLAQRISRVADSRNLSDAAAALAEIRALGDLKGAGIPARPLRETGKSKVTEFVVGLEARSGAALPEVYIEVATKLMSDEEAKALAAFRSAPRQAHAGRLSFSTLTSYPFGRPKKKKDPENVALNAASKLAQVKQSSLQAKPGAPFVLWIDLHDEDMFGLGEEQVEPIIIGRDGELFSGALWMGMYGRRRLRMFERHSLHLEGLGDTVPMSFDGKFMQDENVSAVIFSMPTLTVALENPWAAHPAPTEFMRALLALRRFSLARSWMRWPRGRLRLRRRIAETYRDIRAV